MTIVLERCKMNRNVDLNCVIFPGRGREQLVQLLHVHHLLDHNNQMSQAQYLMSTIQIAAEARNLHHCPLVKLLN